MAGNYSDFSISVSGSDLYSQGTANNPKATTLFEIIGAADGYDAMLKGSIASTSAALCLALCYRIPTKDISKGIQEGSERLFGALLIRVVVDWIRHERTRICRLSNSGFRWFDPTRISPSLVFVLAAGIAFATGTSFGTMGTRCLLLFLSSYSPSLYEIILAVSAAVLSGATWGDHCSPISDTTVFSGGADCDHAEHIEHNYPTHLSRTISLFIARWLWCSLGLTLILGSVACIATIILFGKKILPVAPPEAIKDDVVKSTYKNS